MEGNGLLSGLIHSTAPRLKSNNCTPATAQDFESFAVLPSNAQAVETAKLFASRRASFVALIGPSGCGKSHLLSAASQKLQMEFMDNSLVADATTWAMGQLRYDTELPLILDNVQDATAKSRVKLQLSLALQRRVKARRPTLLSFTASSKSRTVRSFLPHSKEWIVCPMSSPEAGERLQLVRHWCASEGLSISEALAYLLSTRMKGSSPTLLGALKRLRLYHSQWTDPSMTLRACGMLNMFFADDSSWDLRDHIWQSAQQFCDTESLSDARELALFTMLRIATLCEADVAAYFAIEQGLAYNTASQLEKRICCTSNSEERDEVLGFLRFTIARLIED